MAAQDPPGRPQRTSSVPSKSHIYSIANHPLTPAKSVFEVSDLTNFRTTSTSAVYVDQIDLGDEVITSGSQSDEDDAGTMHAALDYAIQLTNQAGGKCVLSVALENQMYLVVVDHSDGQNALLGIHRTERGLFEMGCAVPIARHGKLQLDGDGGFHFTPIQTRRRTYVFKPASVRSLWSAVQLLLKILEGADDDPEKWSWLSEYRKLVKSQATEQLNTNRWSSEIPEKVSELERIRQRQQDLELAAQTPRIQLGAEDKKFEEELIKSLKALMFVSDLDTITSKFLRLELEKQFNRNLKPHKALLDEHMITIMGQMDKASKIFDYMYLGTEWNASNKEELDANNCRYVLNVTCEIPRFFPEDVEYYTVELWDTPDAELMPHWENTFRFIRKARQNNSNVLVHCKMGVSRSASTVIAYAMKQYEWTLEQAHAYVKKRRRIIKPNEGFKQQLVVYEGILRAKRQSGTWGNRLKERPQTDIVPIRGAQSKTKIRDITPPDSPINSRPGSPTSRHTRTNSHSPPPKEFDWSRTRSLSDGDKGELMSPQRLKRLERQHAEEHRAREEAMATGNKPQGAATATPSTPTSAATATPTLSTQSPRPAPIMVSENREETTETTGSSTGSSTMLPLAPLALPLPKHQASAGRTTNGATGAGIASGASSRIQGPPEPTPASTHTATGHRKPPLHSSHSAPRLPWSTKPASPAAQATPAVASQSPHRGLAHPHSPSGSRLSGSTTSVSSAASAISSTVSSTVQAPDADHAKHPARLVTDDQLKALHARKQSDGLVSPSVLRAEQPAPPQANPAAAPPQTNATAAPPQADPAASSASAETSTAQPPAVQQDVPAAVGWEAHLLCSIQALAAQVQALALVQQSPSGESEGGAAAWRAESRDELLSWDTAAVVAFLEGTGLSHYAPEFERQQLTGRDLLDLNHGDLKSIGIHILSERKAILRAIHTCLAAPPAS